jgi:Fe-S-cluster formation regulator IscX/YfhJ
VFAAMLVAGIAGVATWLSHGADFDEFASHTRTFTHSPDRQQTRLIIASVLALAIGTVSAPLWLGPRSMRGSLVVTPWGVQCRRPLSGFTLPWNDIAAVDDEYQQGRQQRQLKPLTFRLTDGRQKVCYLSQFGDDATELYCMIVHYHRNPALRIELTDGRAAQRLRDRTFTTA